MTSGPQSMARVLEGSNGARADHGGHHPDVAAPGAGGAIDRHLNFQVELAAPLFQFVAVQHVLGSARAIQQNDPAKLLPLRHQAVERRPQGRQPDSAGHNHDIAAGRFFHRPMAAEGAANAHDLAALELRMALVTVPTTRVVCLSKGTSAGVAADGDGHFSHAEDVQHVELARRKREPRAGIFGKNLQREGVVGLLLYALNAVRHGQHGVWDRAAPSQPRFAQAWVPYISSNCNRVASRRSVMTCINRL